jgi:hypothetical protein
LEHTPAGGVLMEGLVELVELVDDKVALPDELLYTGFGRFRR